MPLPILHRMNPEQTTFRTGSGYSDWNKLLKELHEGVLELGVGECEVRCKDDPMTRQLGFELYTQKDGVWRSWEFMIPLTKFKGTGAGWHPQLSSVAGRAQIAQWLQEGRTVVEMEALRCSTPG